jgi:hypothetical protein
MVRYKVEPDRVAENEELFRAVYEDRVEEAPVVSEVSQIGSFHLLEDRGQS